MTRRINNLGNDKISRLIVRLALPSMLAQFVSVLYGIVDRIFIGNLPGIGETALAGVGVCAPILTLITSFSYLVGLGGAPICAMRLGAGNREGAQKILSNCFLMLLVMSGILIALFGVLHRPILMAFGASENTFGYARDYLLIYLSGTFFAILTLGLNSFITCQGFSGISMATVIIGAVANIALDPLFIFVLGLGVKGAAIATVISQAASCAFVIIFLLGKRTAIKLNFKGLAFKTMRRVAKLGFSPFMIVATDSVVLIILNSVLQKYGGAAGDTLLTVATIVISYMQLITMPMGGITMGCQPILSFNYGAGDNARVKRAYRGVIVTCLIFAGVMMIFSQAVPDLFVRIFSNDQSLVVLTAKTIKIYTAGIIFMAVQYACVDSLTALGKAGIAISLSMTRKIVIMLPLTLLLPRFWGAESAFWAEPAADFAAFILSGAVSLFVFNRLLKSGSESRSKLILD